MVRVGYNQVKVSMQQSTSSTRYPSLTTAGFGPTGQVRFTLLSARSFSRPSSTIAASLRMSSLAADGGTGIEVFCPLPPAPVPVLAFLIPSLIRSADHETIVPNLTAGGTSTFRCRQRSFVPISG